MKTGKNYPYTQAHRHSASDTVLWLPAYGAVCVCRLAKYQKKNCITCFNVGKLVLAEIKREQDKPNAMKIKNEHSRALTQTHAHTERERRMPNRSETEQSIIRYNTIKQARAKGRTKKEVTATATATASYGHSKRLVADLLYIFYLTNANVFALCVSVWVSVCQMGE